MGRFLLVLGLYGCAERALPLPDEHADLAVPLDLTVTPDLAASDDLAVAVDLRIEPWRGFATPSFLPLAGGLSSLVAGDLDGDGHPDLVLGGQTLSASLGRGDGSFAPLRFTDSSPALYRVLVADLDGDGRLDLAAISGGLSSSGGSVLWQAGLGDGSFGPPQILSTNGYFTDLAAADLDGDGRLDLVAAGGWDVWAWRAQASGLRSPQKSPNGFSDSRGLVLADADGDGRPDAVLTASAGVCFHHGAGDGSFAPCGLTSTGDHVAIEAGDFNGDGRLDLFLPGRPDEVLAGAGDGSFALGQLSSFSSTRAAATGDFDGDGHGDVAVVAVGSGRDLVSTLLGDGALGFAAPSAPLGTGHFTAQLAAADFDGDGHRDLATASDGRVLGALGLGDGTFAAQSLFASLPYRLAVGDFDGDGRLDALGAGSFAFELFRGNGDGSLGDAVLSDSGDLDVATLIGGDFDGDGRRDVAAYSQNVNPGWMGVWLCDAEGRFHPPAQRQAVRPLAAGDFDGDGKLDLAVAVSGAVGISRGRGDGSFADPLASTPGSCPDGTAVDLDGDGLLDLLCAGTVPDADAGVLAGVLLFRGNGATLAPAEVTLYAAGYGYPGALAVGDFDGDGRPDVAATWDRKELRWMSLSGGRLMEVGRQMAPEIGRLVSGDFDGDGFGDLLVAGAAAGASLWRGGPGGLGPPQPLPLAGAGGSELVESGDFDGDGRPDLVAPLSVPAPGIYLWRNL